MSEQYSGGIITKTPVTPSGPYETSTASGIWTLTQQAYWQKQGLWPTAGNVAPSADAQFNYVTMLLHGDGTNGAQNNTFLDSGPNTLTMTRVNTPTQGAFGPFGSNWSNYFGGSAGDKLSAANNAAFALGSGDFTVESWFFLNNTSSAMCMFENRPSNTALGINMFVNYSAAGQVQYRDSSGAPISSSITVTAGTWNHYALVRSGSTVTLWINGQSGGTVTKTTNFTNTTCVLAQDQGGGFNFGGYLSNFRIVKGTAVYTSAFTPSTTPLTAISGTSILTCQSNCYKDSSSNNFPITQTGTVSVQRFNPFGTSTAYSTSVIGGSSYFNSANSDAITFPSSSQFTLGTNDFTIECWVYLDDDSSRKYVYAPGNDTNSHYDGFGLEIWGQATCMWASSNGTSWNMLECDTFANRGTILIPLKSWTHIAVTRTGGNTFKNYVNGVLDRTFTNSGSIINDTSQILNIGRTTYLGSFAPFNGYISNFRVVNGTAVYTAAFTPPTAPLTAITNTKVLALSTNAGIFDNAMMNNLQTVGNAEISTGVFKFGTGSLDFDGTGDYLLGSSNPNMSFGVGNFTVEAWVYRTASPGNNQTIFQKGRTSDAHLEFSMVLTGSNFLSCFYTTDGSTVAQPFSSTTAVPLNTWTHIAISRSGSTWRCFVNGTLEATTTAAVTLYTGAGNISSGANPVGDNPLTGYIDDLRITKGYARYTATFTPPTAAFPNYGPT